MQHAHHIESIGFSHDGKRLYSVIRDLKTQNKSVIVWNLDPQSWLKKACQIANRNFSQEEWRNYFGTLPRQKICPELPTDTQGALKHIKQAQTLASNMKYYDAVKKLEKIRKLDARFMVFFDDLETEVRSPPFPFW